MLVGGILAALVLALAAPPVRADDSREVLPPLPPRSSQESCPRLGSDLRQLLNADDPTAFAAQHGLFFDGERVRVEVDFAAPAEDIPAKYDLIVEASYRQRLQALAPLSHLCPLSDEPSVIEVRSPSPAQPA